MIRIKTISVADVLGVELLRDHILVQRKKQFDSPPIIASRPGTEPALVCELIEESVEEPVAGVRLPHLLRPRLGAHGG